ncbi:NAD dependent epimerase/dehydratase domain protein [Leptospira kirschneri str. 200801925]|nr:NAD dependent epimerase/dehydratase domain protein [Leptospira kirschneri str. 200801925]
MNFKKTILVTGGSGSLGLVLVPELLKSYRVICIGRKLSSFPNTIRFHSNFIFYEVDLEDDSDFSIREKPEFIIHLAGKVSGQASTLEEYKKETNFQPERYFNLLLKIVRLKFCFLALLRFMVFWIDPLPKLLR